MWRAFLVGSSFALVAGCGNVAKPKAEPPALSAAAHEEKRVQVVGAPAPAPIASVEAPFWQSYPMCEPVDWTSRTLRPLLEPGKTKNPNFPDQSNTTGVRIDESCRDHPDGPPDSSGFATGVRLGPGAPSLVVHLDEVTPAGKSGRGWPGNQCTISLGVSRVHGRGVRLDPEVLPPFNGLTSLVWTGSAAWVELSFDGNTKDFPTGGNRVVAVDLCYGRVIWKSEDGVSNGGLLLVGNYLLTVFGVTGEPRFVRVFDAYSGELLQKVPVVPNICPPSSPGRKGSGTPCEGAASDTGPARNPRIEGGLLLVDTELGQSAFELK